MKPGVKDDPEQKPDVQSQVKVVKSGSNEVNETKEEERRADLLHVLTYFGTELILEHHHPYLPSKKIFTKTVEVCENCVVRPLGRTEIVWETVSLPYTVLLKMVSLEGCEPLLRASVSNQFIAWLFHNFNSPDQRERDKVKVILHRLYCKMHLRRPFMRRKISDLLLRHVHEEKVNGVLELLQLYSCIVSGFGVPIRKEHLVFLEKVLFPLHRVEDLKKIDKFLTYCITQFLYKDCSLARKIFDALLKQWPTTSSEKQLLFLQEVEDLLQVVEPFQFKKIHQDLLKQLSTCIMCPLFQVSERCLTLFENERVLSLCLQNPKTVLPLLLPALASAPRIVPPARILHLLACLEAADSQLFHLLATASQHPP